MTTLFASYTSQHFLDTDDRKFLQAQASSATPGQQMRCDDLMGEKKKRALAIREYQNCTECIINKASPHFCYLVQAIRLNTSRRATKYQHTAS